MAVLFAIVVLYFLSRSASSLPVSQLDTTEVVQHEQQKPNQDELYKENIDSLLENLIRSLQNTKKKSEGVEGFGLLMTDRKLDENSDEAIYTSPSLKKQLRVGTVPIQSRWSRSPSRKGRVVTTKLSKMLKRHRRAIIDLDKLDPNSLAALEEYLRAKLLNGTGNVQMRYGRSLKNRRLKP